MDFDGPYDYEKESSSSPSFERIIAWLEQMATLRHDWCQWEYQMDDSMRWECEEEW